MLLYISRASPDLPKCNKYIDSLEYKGILLCPYVVVRDMGHGMLRVYMFSLIAFDR